MPKQTSTRAAAGVQALTRAARTQPKRKRRAAEPVQEDLDWLQTDLLALPEQAGRDQLTVDDRRRILQCLLSEEDFAAGASPVSSGIFSVRQRQSALAPEHQEWTVGLIRHLLAWPCQATS